MVYRKKNGRRLDDKGQANALSHAVLGLVLAQVFVMARSGGLRLRVAKYEGSPQPEVKDSNDKRLNVEVDRGIVRRAWLG